MAGQHTTDFDCFVTNRFMNENIESSHHSENHHTNSSHSQMDEFLDLTGSATSSGTTNSFSNREREKNGFAGMDFQVSLPQNIEKTSSSNIFSFNSENQLIHGESDEFSKLASQNEVIMQFETSATFSNNPFSNKERREDWFTMEAFDGSAFGNEIFAATKPDVKKEPEDCEEQIKLSSKKNGTSKSEFVPGNAGSKLLPKQNASVDSSDISYILSDDRDENDHASSVSNESRQDKDTALVQPVAFAKNPFSNAKIMPSQKVSKERKSCVDQVFNSKGGFGVQTSHTSQVKETIENPGKGISVANDSFRVFETFAINPFVAEKNENENSVSKVTYECDGDSFGGGSLFQISKCSTSNDQGRDLTYTNDNMNFKEDINGTDQLEEESEVFQDFATNHFISEKIGKEKNEGKFNDSEIFESNEFQEDSAPLTINAFQNHIDGSFPSITKKDDSKISYIDDSDANQSSKLSLFFDTFGTNPFYKDPPAIASGSADSSDCSFLTSGSRGIKDVEPVDDIMAVLAKTGLSDPFGQNEANHAHDRKGCDDSSDLSFTLSVDLDNRHNSNEEESDYETTSKNSQKNSHQNSHPAAKALFVDEEPSEDKKIASVEETSDISFSLSDDNDDQINSSEMLRYMNSHPESMFKGPSAGTTSSVGESADSSLISFLTHSSLDPDDRFTSPKKPQSLLTPSNETKERWRRALRPTPESLPTARGRIKVLQCSPSPKAFRNTQFNSNEFEKRMRDAEVFGSIVVMYDSVHRLIGYPVEKAMYSPVQKQLAYPVDDAAFMSEQENILKLQDQALNYSDPEAAEINGGSHEALKQPAIKIETTPSEMLNDVILIENNESEMELQVQDLDSIECKSAATSWKAQNTLTKTASEQEPKDWGKHHDGASMVEQKGMAALQGLNVGTIEPKSAETPDESLETTIEKEEEVSEKGTCQVGHSEILSNFVEKAQSCDSGAESFNHTENVKDILYKQESESKTEVEEVTKKGTCQVGHSEIFSNFVEKPQSCDNNNYNSGAKPSNHTENVKDILYKQEKSESKTEVPKLAEETSGSKHSLRVHTYSKRGQNESQKNVEVNLKTFKTPTLSQAMTPSQRNKLNLCVTTNESNQVGSPRIDSFAPLRHRQNQAKMIRGSNIADAANTPVAFASPKHDPSSPSVKHMINYWEHSSPSSKVTLTPK